MIVSVVHRRNLAVRAMVRRTFTLAGVQVDRKVLASFADSFERFHARILTVHMPARGSGKHRPINACVLRLIDTAVAWLHESSWFLPRQTVVYGIGGVTEVKRFGALGINALLESSSDVSVRAAVDATQSILCRGIGACDRVPLATLVRIEADRRTWTGITKNIGCGGMAIRLLRNATLPQEITLNVILPYAGSLSLLASPRWYSGRLLGLRFQSTGHEKALRQWVHDYSLLGCERQPLRAKHAFA
jgi:PilZ domain